MDRRNAGMAPMMPFFPGPGIAEQTPNMPTPDMPPFPHMRERFPNAVWGAEGPQSQWGAFHPPGLAPPTMGPPSHPTPHQYGNQFEPRQPVFNFQSSANTQANGPNTPVSQFNNGFNPQYNGTTESGASYVPQGHFSPQTTPTSVPYTSGGFLSHSQGNGLLTNNTQSHPHQYSTTNDYQQQQQQQQAQSQQQPTQSQQHQQNAAQHHPQQNLFKSPLPSPAVSTAEASPAQSSYAMSSLPSPHAHNANNEQVQNATHTAAVCRPSPYADCSASMPQQSPHNNVVVTSGVSMNTPTPTPPNSSNGGHTVQSRLKNMIMSRQGTTGPQGSAFSPGAGLTDSPPPGELRFSGSVAAVTSVESSGDPSQVQESFKLAQNFLAYRTTESGPGSVVQLPSGDKGMLDVSKDTNDLTISSSDVADNTQRQLDSNTMANSTSSDSKNDCNKPFNTSSPDKNNPVDTQLQFKQPEEALEELFNGTENSEMEKLFSGDGDQEFLTNSINPPEPNDKSSNFQPSEPPDKKTDVTNHDSTQMNAASSGVNAESNSSESGLSRSNENFLKQGSADKNSSSNLSVYDFPDSPDQVNTESQCSGFRIGRARGAGPPTTTTTNTHVRPACSSTPPFGNSGHFPVLSSTHVGDSGKTNEVGAFSPNKQKNMLQMATSNSSTLSQSSVVPPHMSSVSALPQRYPQFPYPNCSTGPQPGSYPNAMQQNSFYHGAHPHAMGSYNMNSAMPHGMRDFNYMHNARYGCPPNVQQPPNASGCMTNITNCYSVPKTSPSNQPSYHPHQKMCGTSQTAAPPSQVTNQTPNFPQLSSIPCQSPQTVTSPSQCISSSTSPLNTTHNSITSPSAPSSQPASQGMMQPSPQASPTNNNQSFMGQSRANQSFNQPMTSFPQSMMIRAPQSNFMLGSNMQQQSAPNSQSLQHPTGPPTPANPNNKFVGPMKVKSTQASPTTPINSNNRTQKSPQTNNPRGLHNLSQQSNQGLPILSPQSLPTPSPQSMSLPSPQGVPLQSPQNSSMPSPHGQPHMNSLQGVSQVSPQNGANQNICSTGATPPQSMCGPTTNTHQNTPMGMQPSPSPMSNQPGHMMPQHQNSPQNFGSNYTPFNNPYQQMNPNFQNPHQSRMYSQMHMMGNNQPFNAMQHPIKNMTNLAMPPNIGQPGLPPDTPAPKSRSKKAAPKKPRKPRETKAQQKQKLEKQQREEMEKLRLQEMQHANAQYPGQVPTFMNKDPGVMNQPNPMMFPSNLNQQPFMYQQWNPAFRDGQMHPQFNKNAIKPDGYPMQPMHYNMQNKPMPNSGLLENSPNNFPNKTDIPNNIPPKGFGIEPTNRCNPGVPMFPNQESYTKTPNQPNIFTQQVMQSFSNKQQFDPSSAMRPGIDKKEPMKSDIFPNTQMPYMGGSGPKMSEMPGQLNPCKSMDTNMLENPPNIMQNVPDLKPPMAGTSINQHISEATKCNASSSNAIVPLTPVGPQYVQQSPCPGTQCSPTTTNSLTSTEETPSLTTEAHGSVCSQVDSKDNPSTSPHVQPTCFPPEEDKPLSADPICDATSSAPSGTFTAPSSDQATGTASTPSSVLSPSDIKSEGSINDSFEEMKSRMRANELITPKCSCVVPPGTADSGPVYTHLGAGATFAEVRQDIEERTGFKGRALRMEKVVFSGKEGKTESGCPLPKWIIRRSGREEKALVVVKHRSLHTCSSAWIVVVLVAWEGINQPLADDLYSTLVEKLNRNGNTTERRCGSNDDRTCACQGTDPETCGASFSFGCSWSMYYNMCKFARSKNTRKFRLNEEKEEPEVERKLQNIATVLGPVYEKMAPMAYKHQTILEEDSLECRLGTNSGRPWTGVTACMDFCSHSHRDNHNINNGCTVVATLSKFKPEEQQASTTPKEDMDEQFHLLPLYVLDTKDEDPTAQTFEQRVQSGALEILKKYPFDMRLRSEPLLSCRARTLLSRGLPLPNNIRGKAKAKAKVLSMASGRRKSSGDSPPKKKAKSEVKAITDKLGLDVDFLGCNSNDLEDMSDDLSKYSIDSDEYSWLLDFGNESSELGKSDTGKSKEGSERKSPTSSFVSKLPYSSPNEITNKMPPPASPAQKKPTSPCNFNSPQNPSIHSNQNADANSSPPTLVPVPHLSPFSPPMPNLSPHGSQTSPNSPDKGAPQLPCELPNTTIPPTFLETPSSIAAAHTSSFTINHNSPEMPRLSPHVTFNAFSPHMTMRGEKTSNTLTQSSKQITKPGANNTMDVKLELADVSSTSEMFQNEDDKYAPVKLEYFDNGLPLQHGEEKPFYFSKHTNNLECFQDSTIGGVGIALTHGSVLFEYAKQELHSTTALRNPNRKDPKRISLVFYHHKNLIHRNHGCKELEEKMERKRLEMGKDDKDGKLATKKRKTPPIKKGKDLEPLNGIKRMKPDAADTLPNSGMFDHKKGHPMTNKPGPGYQGNNLNMSQHPDLVSPPLSYANYIHPLPSFVENNRPYSPSGQRNATSHPSFSLASKSPHLITSPSPSLDSFSQKPTPTPDHTYGNINASSNTQNTQMPPFNTTLQEFNPYNTPGSSPYHSHFQPYMDVPGSNYPYQGGNFFSKGHPPPPSMNYNATTYVPQPFYGLTPPYSPGPQQPQGQPPGSSHGMQAQMTSSFPHGPSTPMSQGMASPYDESGRGPPSQSTATWSQMRHAPSFHVHGPYTPWPGS